MKIMVIKLEKNYIIKVYEKVLSKEMYYKNTLILSYTIQYPEFISDKFKNTLHQMNKYYENEAIKYQNYCEQTLFQAAVKEYEYSVANGFPVRAFEAISVYAITLNSNCAISLYFDRYEFTGGAHGSTFRSSDTWYLKLGRRITLHELFPKNKNHEIEITKEINRQIEEQISNGNNIYFEDYKLLVVQNFNNSNFYLNPNSFAIFYQQYDIAPYASGIPVFKIPYKTVGAVPPHC